MERELDIPVFHDDQHGTAIVVTAALINALRVVGKKMEDVHIVLNGPGAAGTAIIKMLDVYKRQLKGLLGILTGIHKVKPPFIPEVEI